MDIRGKENNGAARHVAERNPGDKPTTRRKTPQATPPPPPPALSVVPLRPTGDLKLARARSELRIAERELAEAEKNSLSVGRKLSVVRLRRAEVEDEVRITQLLLALGSLPPPRLVLPLTAKREGSHLGKPPVQVKRAIRPSLPEPVVLELLASAVDDFVKTYKKLPKLAKYLPGPASVVVAAFESADAQAPTKPVPIGEENLQRYLDALNSAAAQLDSKAAKLERANRTAKTALGRAAWKAASKRADVSILEDARVPSAPATTAPVRHVSKPRQAPAKRAGRESKAMLRSSFK